MKKLLGIILCSLLTLQVASGQELADYRLEYKGKSGTGKGKHIVLIAYDHEYRSEESLPALPGFMAKRYGFHCTVLFRLDENWNFLQVCTNLRGIELFDIVAL